MSKGERKGREEQPVRVRKLAWASDAAHEELREFPPAARRRAGQEIRRIQEGEKPIDIEPMREVGPGVFEIRIDVGQAFRVFYVAKYGNVVGILHCFEKKTQKTPLRNIRIGRERLKELKRKLGIR